MSRARRTRRFARYVLGVTGLAAIFLVANAGVALADSASDGRATFVAGQQPTTCPQVGVDEKQIGSAGPTSNANLSGTVVPNAGPIQTGTGQELDVAVLTPDTRVDAVIVVSPGGYNKYVAPNLPGALPPPQHYITPLSPTGAVQNISSWFVCYAVSPTYVAAGGIVVTQPPAQIAFTGNSHTSTYLGVGVAAITVGTVLVVGVRRRRRVLDRA
jgi:hypothetical protein